MHKFIYIAATTVFVASVSLSTVCAGDNLTTEMDTRSDSRLSDVSDGPAPESDMEVGANSALPSVTVAEKKSSDTVAEKKQCQWDYSSITDKLEAKRQEDRAVWEEDKARDADIGGKLATFLLGNPDLSGGSFSIKYKSGVTMKRSESGGSFVINEPVSPRNIGMSTPPGRKYKIMNTPSTTESTSISDSSGDEK